jgi:hypothetical protein
MKGIGERIFQFKIILKGTEPPIWRRIQVPETFTFWDLHVAIQNAMGWNDSHLHEFRVNKFDPQEVIFDDPRERWKTAFLVK